MASVLTEMFGGTLTGFGPYRDSFIAWAGDEHGTAIEVYPVGTEMFPDAGQGQANFRHVSDASPYVATHAAVSVALDATGIFALASREGWRAVQLSRGTNHVIEFWIENTVMLELMTPQMTADYRRAASRFSRKGVDHVAIEATGPANSHR
ncbi:hypothetical protein [Methylibium petroleiphilum]|uniref:hypothetical protein n=1 Tax=Methylibium petroleiphilum TaxID=105560 RepID=UPI00003CC988|nr:hypothetical protein [Methylibium petroleiphilum]